MEWNNGKLIISTTRIRLKDGSIFCPAENLQTAFAKLQQKQPLTFHEEYTIECLFHENVHSKAIRKINIIKGSIDEKILETCTQLYARNKYVKILKKYGVEAKNYNMIKYNGLGYKHSCNVIRKYFEKDGELQVGELLNIANETESGYNKMIKKLIKSGLSKTDAKKELIKLLK